MPIPNFARARSSGVPGTLGLLSCALLTLAMRNAAAAIIVGAGSSVNFADSSIDLGCSDLSIAGSVNASVANVTSIANLGLAGGSLAAGASRISLGGNFVNAGSFVAGSSRVAIVDACGNGTSQFSGATGFYDLVVATDSGKQILFPVATAQSVAHSLTLQGAAGHLLDVGSTVAGQRGVLALAQGAAQTIAYVHARDNHAGVAHIAPGFPAQFNSVDGGNLVNWFLDTSASALAPAPALGAGRWLLIATMLFAAARTLFRRNRKFS
jgi:hypothetical protein